MTRIAVKVTNISNDDEEDFSDGFQVVMSEKDETIELTDDLQPLIAKVYRCKIVSPFSDKK
jgi:hypothetical protein